MFGCSDVYHWMGRAAKAEAVPYGTKVCWRGWLHYLVP